MFWHRLTGKWVGVVQPLNYWVYDHDIFIRCQAPWEDVKPAKKIEMTCINRQHFRTFLVSDKVSEIFRVRNLKASEIFRDLLRNFENLFHGSWVKIFLLPKRGQK